MAWAKPLGMGNVDGNLRRTPKHMHVSVSMSAHNDIMQHICVFVLDVLVLLCIMLQARAQAAHV